MAPGAEPPAARGPVGRALVRRWRASCGRASASRSFVVCFLARAQKSVGRARLAKLGVSAGMRPLASRACRLGGWKFARIQMARQRRLANKLPISLGWRLGRRPRQARPGPSAPEWNYAGACYRIACHPLARRQDGRAAWARACLAGPLGPGRPMIQFLGRAPGRRHQAPSDLARRRLPAAGCLPPSAGHYEIWSASEIETTQAFPRCPWDLAPAGSGSCGRATREFVCPRGPLIWLDSLILAPTRRERKAHFHFIHGANGRA